MISGNELVAAFDGHLRHLRNATDSLIGVEDGKEYIDDIRDEVSHLEDLVNEIFSQAVLLEALRAPFPPAMIGKLPRITCRACSESNSKNCGNHQKRQCSECRNYITTQHMHLDYVGHAAVTDRLNQVDPTWQWRPIRWTEDGQPAFDRNGGMWIELTVLGITRPAYGDAEGKRGADAVKAAISDAIKNGAMRFGVGLDLWSKEDLLAATPEPVEEPKRQRGKPEAAPEAGEVDWLKLCATAVDVQALTEHATACDAAGKFVGAVKSAFLKRKKDLERPLQAVKDEPAAS